MRKRKTNLIDSEYDKDNFFKNFLSLIKDDNVKFDAIWNDFCGIQLISYFGINKLKFNKYFEIGNYEFNSDDEQYCIMISDRGSNRSRVFVQFIISVNTRNYDSSDISYCLKNMMKCFNVPYENVDLSDILKEKEKNEQRLRGINQALENMNLEFI